MKNTPDSGRKQDSFTEISEKKTSILGYLFLFALFVFIIVIGQTIYRDIGHIPRYPVSPAACINSYLSNPENVTRMPTCYFNDIDREFGLDTIIAGLENDFARLAEINRTISGHQKIISNNQREIDNSLKNYDVSLQELMAGEKAILNRPQIKRRISTLMDQNEDLEGKVRRLSADRDSVIKVLRPGTGKLRQAYDKAMDSYRTTAAYYKLKQFLLKLIFILPLFVLFCLLYYRYKKKDSPYTIILTPVFFAVTVLLLQIVLVFLYDILPKEWLARIFRFLMSVAAMKYVIYYLSVGLTILLLGGVVYFIQRAIYNPRRVAARHLKKGKCPHCSLPIKLAETFCPGCGVRIRENCPECQKPMFAGLQYCPGCGHGKQTG